MPINWGPTIRPNYEGTMPDVANIEGMLDAFFKRKQLLQQQAVANAQNQARIDEEQRYHDLLAEDQRLDRERLIAKDQADRIHTQDTAARAAFPEVTKQANTGDISGAMARAKAAGIESETVGDPNAVFGFDKPGSLPEGHKVQFRMPAGSVIDFDPEAARASRTGMSERVRVATANKENQKNPFFQQAYKEIAPRAEQGMFADEKEMMAAIDKRAAFLEGESNKTARAAMAARAAKEKAQTPLRPSDKAIEAVSQADSSIARLERMAGMLEKNADVWDARGSKAVERWRRAEAGGASSPATSAVRGFGQWLGAAAIGPEEYLPKGDSAGRAVVRGIQDQLDEMARERGGPIAAHDTEAASRRVGATGLKAKDLAKMLRDSATRIRHRRDYFVKNRQFIELPTEGPLSNFNEDGGSEADALYNELPPEQPEGPP